VTIQRRPSRMPGIIPFSSIVYTASRPTPSRCAISEITIRLLDTISSTGKARRALSVTGWCRKNTGTGRIGRQMLAPRASVTRRAGSVAGLQGSECSAFWGRAELERCPSITHPHYEGSIETLRLHECRVWRTEFSSVKKGRFSPDLSASGGRTLGKLGALNPICPCTRSSSRTEPVCGNGEIDSECNRAADAGKRTLSPRRPDDITRS
jgi:hypothetical protein